jgi:outer membrane biosynthesis protein TonB
MRGSLIASLLLHVALLVATFIVMPNPEAFKVEEQEMIPVDIVSVEDFSKRMAMTKAPEAPKKVETPRPKPQEVVKEAKPAPEMAPEVKTAAKEPKAEPPPEPKKEEPKKEEAKKTEEPKPLDPDPLKNLIKETVDDTPEPKKEEPKKVEVKKAEVTPEKKPDKKPEKKKPKKELDVSSIENFLNKIDDKKTSPQKPTTETGQPQQSSVNLSGEDQQLAATLIDLLRQRLSQCWAAPAGAREAQIVVKVRFRLDPQGNVIGFPEIVSAGSDPLSQTTAQSAVSAIMDCQAYEFFPADKYDLWKEITINFNPNMMT